MARSRGPEWSFLDEDPSMTLAKLGGLLELLGFVTRLANRPEDEEEGTTAGHSQSWPDGDYVVYSGPGRTTDSAEADLRLHRSRVFIRIGPDDRPARLYRVDRPELDEE